MLQPSPLTILNDQLKREDLIDPLNYATGNGYQKLPYRSPAQHSTIDNEVDHHLAAKLNRMYTQSPQLPRKNYEFTPNMNNFQHHSPQMNHHHMGNQSPYLQRRFPPNEIDYTSNYSPYKPLPPPPQQSTFSPLTRRRYQEGQQMAEDLEFRILHGNTSPIVLQRFYHQQNQLRDQKEEDQLRAIRMQSASPNHYKHSSIPVKSASPLPNTRFDHRQPQMMNRKIMHPESSYASHNIYESQIPQLQSRMTANGNGSIPFRHHHQQQQQHHQAPMYDNLGHRAQIACPSSPQLDRLRANLEKSNFYERHQKLPVEYESSYQVEMSKHQLQNNGSFLDKNKDKGMCRCCRFLTSQHCSLTLWSLPQFMFTLIFIFSYFPLMSLRCIHPSSLCSVRNMLATNRKLWHSTTHWWTWFVNITGWFTSVTGTVRTYIKSRFNSEQQPSRESKSLATVSPIRTSINTNPFAQSPHHMTPLKMPSSAAQNLYERHRSPDPPPRNSRGNQSPLILRRKLELASSSPLMQKR